MQRAVKGIVSEPINNEQNLQTTADYQTNMLPKPFDNPSIHHWFHRSAMAAARLAVGSDEDVGRDMVEVEADTATLTVAVEVVTEGVTLTVEVETDTTSLTVAVEVVTEVESVTVGVVLSAVVTTPGIKVMEVKVLVPPETVTVDSDGERFTG
jgi:hypothetical protein